MAIEWLRRRRIGCRPQFSDQPQYLGEKGSRNGNLGHLEADIAAAADDLCSDLDQLLVQADQRLTRQPPEPKTGTDPILYVDRLFSPRSATEIEGD